MTHVEEWENKYSAEKKQLEDQSLADKEDSKGKFRNEKKVMENQRRAENEAINKQRLTFRSLIMVTLSITVRFSQAPLTLWLG